jgi:RNA polymerase sigma factor (sigma-70 family)
MQEAVTQQQQQAPAWTFEQLYTAYYGRILACVRALVRCSQEEAEDITQDAFLKALQAFPSLDTNYPVFPWLYEIARNTAYDVLRHKRVASRRGAVALPEDAIYNVGDNTNMEEEVSTRESVQQALQAISPRYRDALLLQGIGGYRCEDIARLLGLTLGSTRTSLKRARAAFKQHYAEEEVPV